MEKRRRLMPIEDEIELPQPIIHHIQSLLDGKQAARTSAVSKSWYRAWLTRPNLDFNDAHFMMFYSVEPEYRTVWFLNFVKKTFRRYQQLNLKIESLKLWMHNEYSESLSFLNELIQKAIRMGVSDISLSIDPELDFVFPYEILETETLVRLHLGDLRINLLPNAKVSCSRVQSLCLSSIPVEDDLFSHGFPCLENLTLKFCHNFRASTCLTIKSLCLWVMPLDSDFFSCTFPCVEDLTIASCCFLRDINKEVITQCFPCLEYLTIKACYASEILEISSNTLKFISLSQMKNLEVKIDVPKICKFKFSGFYFPSELPLLLFMTVSEAWESNISLHIYGQCVNDSWCYKLRRFIRNLGMSRISLRVKFDHNFSYKYSCELKGTPGPVVENLRVLNPTPALVGADILNGLFWSCRPNFITQYWFPAGCIEENQCEKASNEFVKLLCKALIGVHENYIAEDQIFIGNQDLREVNVESSDANLGEWHSMTLKTLLSDTKGPKRKQEIRFRLEWHGSDHASGL